MCGGQSHLRLGGHRRARRARGELSDPTPRTNRADRFVRVGQVQPSTPDRRPGQADSGIGELARARETRDGRSGVGIVFQGPSLLPSLDVTENVSLPMLFGGHDDATAMAEARAALDLVGIGDLAEKLPDELSGGQSQRVAIARVLAARPTLILADEPTGKLDHHHAQRVISVLLDTATVIGAAVLIATHDPAVADRLTEHWTMRDGRLTTPTTDRYPT